MIISLAFVPTIMVEFYVDILSRIFPPEIKEVLHWFEDNYVGRPNGRGT